MATPPDPRDLSNYLTQGEIAEAYTPLSMGVSYSVPPNLRMQAESLLDLEAMQARQTEADNFYQRKSSVFSAIPIAASIDDYFDAIPVYEDESENFYDPRDEALDFGKENAASFYEEKMQGLHGRTYGILQRGPLPPPEYAGEQPPAKISEMPTSTTNPKRPRTVAAGYDPKRQMITVVFRDGTFYNYFEVSALEWGNFKRARSKGRFIYLYLDAKPRGVADVEQIPEAARKTLYKLARTGQIIRKGYTKGQSQTSKRKFRPYRRIY